MTLQDFNLFPYFCAVTSISVTHHLLPVISVFKQVHTSVLYVPLMMTAVETFGFYFNQSWLVKFGNSELSELKMSIPSHKGFFT